MAPVSNPSLPVHVAVFEQRQSHLYAKFQLVSSNSAVVHFLHIRSTAKYELQDRQTGKYSI
jgi:hypothetical protein